MSEIIYNFVTWDDIEDLYYPSEGSSEETNYPYPFD